MGVAHKNPKLVWAQQGGCGTGESPPKASLLSASTGREGLRRERDLVWGPLHLCRAGIPLAAGDTWQTNLGMLLQFPSGAVGCSCALPRAVLLPSHSAQLHPAPPQRILLLLVLPDVPLPPQKYLLEAQKGSLNREWKQHLFEIIGLA